MVRNLPEAPDGGWGWMCCFAGFLVNALSVGQLKSYGILLLDLMDEYESSAALTGWVNGLAYGLSFGFGKTINKLHLLLTDGLALLRFSRL